MKSPIQDFAQTGIFRLQYPAELRVAVLKAQQSWTDFWQLPTAVKKRLPYSNDGAGVGYELKEGIGLKADRKENFDLTIQGLQWLRDHAAAMGNYHALEFTKDASAVLRLLKPSLLEFARQVEVEYGIPGFVKEVDQSEDGYFIRFIHYFGDREDGEETATAHVDQSGFTFHLFESDPGLQCLTYDTREWVDMPVSEGETVIIPAMQLQHRSDGKLRALAHRVVANAQTKVCGRTSAVCFVRQTHTPVYDKEKGGRLQEIPPGSTYDMALEQFKAMFK
ncbi:MAG: hypothetical protein RJB39_447 [Candidatus Parcubacteria bacterium]|jgi:isopenicillin N synthase-like dioxygenase